MNNSESSYDEECNKRIRDRDYVNFILVFIAFISAYIGYHFLGWTAVATSFMIVLGIVMLAIMYNKPMESN